MAVDTSDGRIYLWNLPTGEPITQFETRSGKIVKLQFSADGRKLCAIARTHEPSDKDPGRSKLRFFLWDGSETP